MPIRKLYLELTDLCNLNCAMCYRRSWDKSSGNMTEAAFERVLEDVSGLEELKEVILGGIGEPTMSPLFLRAVEAYKKYGLTITTNGIVDEGEKIEAMAEKASRIIFSIDGLEDYYYSIRGAGLEQVCNTIRSIQEIKKRRNSPLPEIYIQFVLSSDNKEELFGVMSIAAELKVKGLIVSNLIPMTGADSKKILYSRYQNDDMKEYMGRICREALKAGIQVSLPYIELKTERRCSFVEEDAIFVCASGEISPCHRLSHRYDEYVFGRKKKVQPYSFGNICNERLTELWDSPTYTGFRDMLYCSRYPSCIDCDYSDGCDFVRSSEMDCNCNTPACGDCLWSRGIAVCV